MLDENEFLSAYRIRALSRYHLEHPFVFSHGGQVHFGAYYGDSFRVECPTGSGKHLNLFEVARELGERLIAALERNAEGVRPACAGAEKFQTDPHWQDLIPFNEYFHGDNRSGIGASHQTGWTGCVARIIQANGYLSDEMMRTIYSDPTIWINWILFVFPVCPSSLLKVIHPPATRNPVRLAASVVVMPVNGAR